ncbi:hypothetical protein Ancab_005133 [Ancistrocladus abbreviatus]
MKLAGEKKQGASMPMRWQMNLRPSVNLKVVLQEDKQWLSGNFIGEVRSKKKSLEDLLYLGSHKASMLLKRKTKKVGKKRCRKTDLKLAELDGDNANSGEVVNGFTIHKQESGSMCYGYPKGTLKTESFFRENMGSSSQIDVIKEDGLEDIIRRIEELEHKDEGIYEEL